MANNDITFIRPEHGAASPLWETVRDVCRGPDVVKRRRHKYLPKLDPTTIVKRTTGVMMIIFAALSFMRLPVIPKMG